MILNKIIHIVRKDFIHITHPPLWSMASMKEKQSKKMECSRLVYLAQSQTHNAQKAQKVIFTTRLLVKIELKAMDKKTGKRNWKCLLTRQRTHTNAKSCWSCCVQNSTSLTSSTGHSEIIR